MRLLYRGEYTMIDLHCHTRISDNSFSIEDVIQQAEENGVTHLAITDHDTTIGLEMAMEIGKQRGVEIIPAIEVSAYDFKRGTRAHILGHFIEPGHEAIDELCAPLIKQRHQASKQMVEKLMEAGYNITWEEVLSYAEGGTGVYKQHIMHALLDKGYTDRIYGKLYKELFYRGDADHPPGVAYVPITYIDAFDAIKMIKKAKGIPVIAHPGQFNNFDAVSEWVEAGLEGIEVKHPLHNAEHEAKALDLSRRFQLFTTGGSDFHGFYSDTGSTLGSLGVTMDELNALKLRKEQQEVASDRV